MVEVRLFATLAGRAKTGRQMLQQEYRPGLTVRDIVVQEELDPADIHIVMVNGVRAELDAELSDGDRVGLFPPVGGG